MKSVVVTLASRPLLRRAAWRKPAGGVQASLKRRDRSFSGMRSRDGGSGGTQRHRGADAPPLARSFVFDPDQACKAREPETGRNTSYWAVYCFAAGGIGRLRVN